MKAGAIADGRPSSASRSATASVRTVITRRNDGDPHVVNETGRPLSRKRHFLKLDNNIRLKTNRIQEAEELLRGIPADHIAPQLRLPYAHAAGLVALHSKRAELADTASAMLRCIEAEEGGLPVEYEAVLEGLDALRG